MRLYEYLLRQARDGYEWNKTHDKLLTETDALLILLIVLVIFYASLSGIDSWADGRKISAVMNAVVVGLNIVNFILTVIRMALRRKKAKLSREFWEAEIKMLEDALNEDAESKMDIP